MMAGAGNNKDWQTLNDSNVACASAVKNKHQDTSKNRSRSKGSSNVSRANEEKDTSNNKTDVTDGANGLASASTATYSKTGARKRQSGKTKWSHVPIDLPPYRDNRSDHRNNNESHRFTSGRRYNNYESANNFVNGHDNGRGRAFRGGRAGAGRGQFRFRRESTVNSDYRRHNSLSQEASSQVVNFVKETPSYSVDLKSQIKQQVEYYFSAQNLVRDTYLRCHMNEQGYTDLTFVANFPRMTRLTSDLNIILEAVKESRHLEVSDDTKIRPVVDPLRWPLKPIQSEPNAVNTGESLDNLLSAQFYGLAIDPSVYHPQWSYLPVGNSDNNELFRVNNVYPHAASNCIGAPAASLEIANGHVSPPEQHSPTSDFYCEFSSQFVPNNYEIKNVTEFDAVPENHVLPNGISDIASDSNFPNGQTYSSDQVPFPCYGEVSSHDLHIKTEDSFHPGGDFQNSASASESIVSNGLECSSDYRCVSEIGTGAYGYFGPNGVMYIWSIFF